MIGWLLGLAAALLPGQYTGQTATGQALALHLRADGTVDHAGTTWRWAAEGDGLVLTAGAERRRWAVAVDAAGQVVLTGPPFGRATLRLMALDAPAAPPPERPAGWQGTWAHRASGGTLLLTLTADGRAALGPAGEPPARATWRAADGALVLAVDGGPPVRYMARRDGADLVLRGGELPGAVVFEPVSGP
ncbi:MAG: hypothetical protein H6702_25015 [Myxococcales bacterium]|nr:hypothetical protein [Myxococcales bacterium]